MYEKFENTKVDAWQGKESNWMKKLVTQKYVKKI